MSSSSSLLSLTSVVTWAAAFVFETLDLSEVCGMLVPLEEKSRLKKMLEDLSLSVGFDGSKEKVLSSKTVGVSLVCGAGSTKPRSKRLSKAKSSLPPLRLAEVD